MIFQGFFLFSGIPQYNCQELNKLVPAEQKGNIEIKRYRKEKEIKSTPPCSEAKTVE